MDALTRLKTFLHPLPIAKNAVAGCVCIRPNGTTMFIIKNMEIEAGMVFVGGSQSIFIYGARVTSMVPAPANKSNMSLWRKVLVPYSMTQNLPLSLLN